MKSSPASLQKFLAKHLNIEIGLNLRSDRWTGADFWKAQSDESLSLKALLAQSEVVTVGIDGGGLDDLLGLTVLGRKSGSDIWLSCSLAWAHPIALDRRKSEESKYRDFERDGEPSPAFCFLRSSSCSHSAFTDSLRAQIAIARTSLQNIMHATDDSQDDGAHHPNAHSLADHGLNGIAQIEAALSASAEPEAKS